MTSPTHDDASAQELLVSLSRELFQTETSASRHCRREAGRLGDAPPALALRAVADHADAVLRDLPALAQRTGMPVSRGGRLTGELFSQLRDKLFDMMIDSDRSYRGTMLGCRHGIDLMHLLKHLATVQGKLELDQFCEAWLNTRCVLVQRLEDELAWFAKHPQQALELARHPFAAGSRARAHHVSP
ncbi:MAG: hypothetical protein ABW252_05060 [Polyangiales bacterium]